MKAREFFSGLLLIAALLLIAGAVGGYERNTAAAGDMFRMCAVGFGCLFVSYICGAGNDERRN